MQTPLMPGQPISSEESLTAHGAVAYRCNCQIITAQYIQAAVTCSAYSKHTAPLCGCTFTLLFGLLLQGKEYSKCTDSVRNRYNVYYIVTLIFILKRILRLEMAWLMHKVALGSAAWYLFNSPVLRQQ